VKDSKTLIYHYNNTSRKHLGNNKYKLTIEMAVPYRIYQAGDTLINESSHGSVKWLVDGKENHEINKIGSGAAFEELFYINSDSIIYEFITDFDVSLNEDTIFFKKNGKEVLRIFGLKVFDEENKEIKIDKIEIKDKKVKFKFKHTDKTKKVKVDPIWSWQPDATEGIDTEIVSNEDFSHAANTTIHSVWYGDAHEYATLIKFTGFVDSIGPGKIIDSIFISLHENTIYTTAGSIYCKRIAEDWAETVIYSERPTLGSPYSNDTLSIKNDGDWWKWNVTDIYRKYYDGTYTDYGVEIGVIDLSGVQHGMGFESSDHETAGFRPKIDGYYRDEPEASKPLEWKFSQVSNNIMKIDSVGYGSNDTSKVLFELILTDITGSADTLFVSGDTTKPFTYSSTKKRALAWTDSIGVVKGLIPGYSYAYKSRAVKSSSASEWSDQYKFTVKGALKGGTFRLIDPW